MQLTDLTPEQLTALKAQLKAATKARSATRGDRNATVDAMLQERDATGFVHTTSDILSKLQAANLVPSTLDKAERAEELKKIQTRKQLLDAKPEFAGKVGYKASPLGVRAISHDAVIDWLMDDENLKSVTPAERKAIIKAMTA